MQRLVWGLIALAALVSSAAATSVNDQPPSPEMTGYTRYELLAPGSGEFRIIYDITETRAGATAFFNPIRKGSISTDESVIDRASGAPLAFKVVSGADAKAEMPKLDPTYDYIRVTLARPVPVDGGEGRIRILKTYEDKKSYYQTGDEIVFDRSLGIKRNAVVLPKGYGLVTCNYPSQVEQEADGRIKVSFLNVTPAEAPLKLTAKPMNLPAGPSSVQKRRERALQTRDIVYFLRDPDSHAFDLYHDYTEERVGTNRYINVVRTGSAAANPSARNLDTGEAIPAQILKGDEITKAGITDPDLPSPITADSEIVVFPFSPLKEGQSIRLRMSETYTDPGRYKRVGDELIFDRSFGRPANAVVLPAGWELTNSTIPGTISRLPDGRVRLDFLNPRPDEIDVLITAKRAKAQ